MLVLSRKVGESILIGYDITVAVVRTGPTSIRIGIDAPRGMTILREELRGTQEQEVTGSGRKPIRGVGL